MPPSNLTEDECSDCIGCILLICVVLDNKASMHLRLVIVFMFVLKRKASWYVTTDQQTPENEPAPTKKTDTKIRWMKK